MEPTPIERDEFIEYVAKQARETGTAKATVLVPAPCPVCGVTPTVVRMTLTISPPRLHSECSACGQPIPVGCKTPLP
jgi:hypothetical protein